MLQLQFRQPKAFLCAACFEKMIKHDAGTPCNIPHFPVTTLEGKTSNPGGGNGRSCQRYRLGRPLIGRRLDDTAFAEYFTISLSFRLLTGHSAS